ncbi:class I ribonucleotide reductase maintenance protein YfaE [Proteus faecis]|uniref:class I ribonucleotide reductase maintenance protein YfaE n=1 Tax=Proteus faecis TaxID=2050967 RepID=UPI0021BAB8EE|nr:class I ribonucleotide reductase maintenance protein YfaE [Proteus faecis]MCT8248453.1 class I ribonucleotide reductase maintenance protein YfaE [Proteus faecis]
MASHKVTLHRLGSVIQVDYCSDRHLSLLDALEQKKIQVEYQCREGYCGSCRLRLVHGDISYRNKPLAFTKANEILPCCCHPISDIDIEN